VHQVVSDYNRYGSAAIETPAKEDGRSYLSWEAEVAFRPFIEQAVAGHISTVALIQQAFEQQVGQAVDSSTIYRWRDTSGVNSCRAPLILKQQRHSKLLLSKLPQR